VGKGTVGLGNFMSVFFFLNRRTLIIISLDQFGGNAVGVTYKFSISSGTSRRSGLAPLTIVGWYFVRPVVDGDSVASVLKQCLHIQLSPYGLGG
jgi:hypothetical protein